MTDTSVSLQISRFTGWWIDELTRLFAARPTAVRPWQTMLLRSGVGFEVHLRQGKATQAIGRLDPSTPEEEARGMVAELLRRGGRPETTLLRLAPQEVVTTSLTLPAGVRDMLGPVIRNQLERLAPWPADQALFAFRESAPPESAGQLAVDVWILGRARLESVLSGLGKLGLGVGMVDAGTDVTAAPAFNLLGNGAGEMVERRARTSRALTTAGTMAFVLASAAIGYAYYLGVQRDQLQQTVARELRAALSASTPRAEQARRQRALVLDQRQKAPAMSVALEMLSRALPDNAYLERIEMRNGLMTLSGRAENVPQLIGPLEETSHFANVQFAAPTTRREGEARDEFSLSMRVRPAMTLERRQ